MKREDLLRLEIEVDHEKEELGRAWLYLNPFPGEPAVKEYPDVLSGISALGMAVVGLSFALEQKLVDEVDKKKEAQNG